MEQSLCAKACSDEARVTAGRTGEKTSASKHCCSCSCSSKVLEQKPDSSQCAKGVWELLQLLRTTFFWGFFFLPIYAFWLIVPHSALDWAIKVKSQRHKAKWLHKSSYINQVGVFFPLLLLFLFLSKSLFSAWRLSDSEILKWYFPTFNLHTSLNTLDLSEEAAAAVHSRHSC